LKTTTSAGGIHKEEAIKKPQGHEEEKQQSRNKLKFHVSKGRGAPISEILARI